MIYLDNSATTEISAVAKKKMIEAIEVYGNPSSRHSMGIEARRLIDRAREQVGSALGLSRPSAENLIFTSCGSESNNTAILGSLYSKEKRRQNKVITTDSEHPSVDNVMRKLEKDGFEVVRVSTRGGVIDENEFMSALDDSVALVSLMLVNNETGAVYNVARLFSAVKRRCPDAVTHCDAVQGFLKVPFTVKTLGADMISVSAHKIHGPKGVGALYVSPEVIKMKKIIPYLIGGGQEDGFRSGTENIVGIVGFGEAAVEGRAKIAESVGKMTALRDLCAEKATVAGARPNIPTGQRAPHVLSLTLPDIKSETMLNFLSSKGFCVSSGSACSSHSRHISSSLVGFGLPEHEADCTIRVSFSEYNTEDEIIAFGDALHEGIDSLVRIKR
ncbi:MAG: cysteine desulfurase [Clostridia bacterium]|nr:cysteine desulfurase [Clostridia bacterium]